jgi:hypothetical protein
MVESTDFGEPGDGGGGEETGEEGPSGLHTAGQSPLVALLALSDGWCWQGRSPGTPRDVCTHVIVTEGVRSSYKIDNTKTGEHCSMH